MNVLPQEAGCSSPSGCCNKMFVWSSFQLLWLCVFRWWFAYRLIDFPLLNPLLFQWPVSLLYLIKSYPVSTLFGKMLSCIDIKICIIVFFSCKCRWWQSIDTIDGKLIFFQGYYGRICRAGTSSILLENSEFQLIVILMHFLWNVFLIIEISWKN